MSHMSFGKLGACRPRRASDEGGILRISKIRPVSPFCWRPAVRAATRSIWSTLRTVWFGETARQQAGAA